MRVATIVRDLEIGQTNQKEKRKLFKNKTYIFANNDLSQIKTFVPDAIGLEIPFSEVNKRFTGKSYEDLFGKKILCLRHGGIGDILFLSTAVNILHKRKRYDSSNNLSIDIATSKVCEDVLINHPAIDHIINPPIDLDIWNSYDYHITFEGLIEESPLSKTMNAYDLFLLPFGFTPNRVSASDKIPEIFINKEEIPIILKKLNHNLSETKKKIGIQLAASSKLRSYPMFKFKQLIDSLDKTKYDIYIFGNQIQAGLIQSFVEVSPENVFNASSNNLRDSIILASLLDLMIAPDSSFIHIAAALRIPVIGLYGPFPSQLRMLYFKNAIGIDAKTKCSPCFRHGGLPCSKGDPSPCLNLITPEHILGAIEELLK